MKVWQATLIGLVFGGILGYLLGLIVGWDRRDRSER